MGTTTQAVAISTPRSKQPENRVQRFFKHAFSSIPAHAQIISSKIVSKQGQRSAAFTYRIDGKVVSESFNMGGQKS